MRSPRTSKGKKIHLPNPKDRSDHQLLFHAGTRLEGDEVVTAGGMVMASVGLGAELEKAVEKAYELAEKVEFEGVQFRSDIGSVG